MYVTRKTREKILGFSLMSALTGLALSGCGLFQKTEILWDTWGVPHIFATDMEEMHYAFGWAQMQNHGNLILGLYGQARGRSAEYWGSKYLESDRIIRTMNVPDIAQQWDAAQNGTYRTYLDAFVEGMNAYADTHSDQLIDSVKVVLPIQRSDISAHILRAIHLTFVGGGAVPMANRWATGRENLGSNAWAIAPSRSERGHAMLLANPHLPWSDLFTFFEAQLTAPGINAYGAALVGMPVLAIAFNDHLGWTHTNNVFDGMDLYELTLTEEGYAWDDGSRSFEIDKQVIKVRGADGAMRNEEIVIKRSVHGPVLSEEGGKAIAVRLVGLDQPLFAEQYLDMMRARNLSEFEAAVSRLQNPYFNVIYADADGHIMYLFGGRTPKRLSGDWAYWQGIIPGHTSKTLWSETHIYKDLPRIVDPPTGWVQNANDPPWTSTLPPALKSTDFPPYLSSGGMSFRAQRSARMLEEDELISFNELLAYKHSTRMELADRILDDLISAARKYGNPRVLQAADVLESWDRMANADSRGAVLFAAWKREAGQDIFAMPWNPLAPRTTPSGLKNPRLAVTALDKASQTVIDTYQALDIPWGEVFRIQYGEQNLPANGGPGSLGIFRTINFASDGTGRFRQVVGDSYVAAIEFSRPVRAKAVINYGNATQPGSPHVGDQLEFFTRKKLRTVWRTREDIEAHLESREAF